MCLLEVWDSEGKYVAIAQIQSEKKYVKDPAEWSMNYSDGFAGKT